MGLGLLCGCGGLVLGLLVAAVMLRAAVSLANRVVGPVKTDPLGDPYDWDWDEEPDPEPPRRAAGEKAIPEPNLGKGLLIVFAAGFVSAFAFAALNVFAEEALGVRLRGDEGKLVLGVFTLPFAFLALTLILVAMLPTTFWRAALVAFLYDLLVGAIALTVGGAVYVFFTIVGP